MRVLEVMSGHGVNGAVIHCLLLTRQLAARGNSVTLLCRHNAWIASQLLPEVANGSVTIVESDMRRWPLHELRRIAAIAAEQGIDVINTHMTRAHNFGVFLRHFSGIPCVATAHSHIVHFHWWMADRIIAVSEATRRYHRTHNLIPARRIETVHGFVDIGRFAPMPPQSRQALRAELGLDEDALLIGAIGDFLPRKAQHALIRALPAILKAVPQARLALAGSVRDQNYMRFVQSEAERHGVTAKILWLGYRQDVPQLLDALDVYVLASFEETFGLALVEAMASGRPVVSTACGGPQEILSGSESGFLVTPGDQQALSEALITLLLDADLRERFGNTARETVCRHFTVESQTPKIEAAFARAIATTKGHGTK